jgi:hypothetical protein
LSTVGSRAAVAGDSAAPHTSARRRAARIPPAEGRWRAGVLGENENIRVRLPVATVSDSGSASVGALPSGNSE